MTVEALCSELRSLFKVTNSLYLSVEKEDYSSLSEMLDRRGQILDSQNRLADAWKISFVTEGDRQQQVSRLRPLVEILEQLDKRIVTLFEKKKEELAEKLKQAQNQKRLRAYSR